MIAQDVVERILRETDIVDVVSPVVTLKKRGQNFVGLCPFHLEKTPSFNVNPERQIYKCFGCAKAGDAVSFLRETQGLSFVEAVRALGERLGIQVEDEESSDEERAAKAARERDLELLERATVFFQRQLETERAAHAREYLARRGIDATAIERFRLGWAPGGSSLLEAARKAGFEPARLEDVGLVSRREDGQVRDFFFERIMFPIENERGRVIAFGARTLVDRGPKYLNSRETRVFRKSATLYGLGRARSELARQRRAVLVEGYTDVIACHLAGCEVAVAALGTALTDEHLRTLRRHVDRIDLVYDGDEAGQNAARRAVELVQRARLAARVALMPAGDDPADVLQEVDGKARFEASLAAAIEPILFVIARAREAHDTSTVDGKAAAIRECLVFAEDAPELERTLAAERIAQAFGVPVAALAQAAERAYRPPQRPRPDAMPAGADAGVIESLLAACLTRPDQLFTVEDRLSPGTLAATMPHHAAILGAAIAIMHERDAQGGLLPEAAELGALLKARITEEARSTLASCLARGGITTLTAPAVVGDCLRLMDEREARRAARRLADAAQEFDATDPESRDRMLAEHLAHLRESPRHARAPGTTS